MASFENMQEVAPGVWQPAIPLKAPWDVRIKCDHRYVPSDPMIEWACVRCGERRDGFPKDGRRWLGRLWVRLRG